MEPILDKKIEAAKIINVYLITHPEGSFMDAYQVGYTRNLKKANSIVKKILAKTKGLFNKDVVHINKHKALQIGNQYFRIIAPITIVDKIDMIDKALTKKLVCIYYPCQEKILKVKVEEIDEFCPSDIKYTNLGCFVIIKIKIIKKFKASGYCLYQIEYE